MALPKTKTEKLATKVVKLLKSHGYEVTGAHYTHATMSPHPAGTVYKTVIYPGTITEDDPYGEVAAYVTIIPDFGATVTEGWEGYDCSDDVRRILGGR